MPSYSTANGPCDTTQVNKWIQRRVAEGAIDLSAAASVTAFAHVEDWLQALLKAGYHIPYKAVLSIGWVCAGLPIEVAEDGASTGTRFTLRGALCDAVPIYHWLYDLWRQGYITSTEIHDLQYRFANVMDIWLFGLLTRIPANVVASVFLVCPYAQSRIDSGQLVTYPEAGGRVWVIVDAQRREIVQRNRPGDVFGACGYRLDGIRLYPRDEIESYPTGASVRWLSWAEGQPDCPYGKPPPAPPVQLPPTTVPISNPSQSGLPPIVQLIKDNFHPRLLHDPNAWITMTCIACWESGLFPDAYNRSSGASGLTQILQSHFPGVNLLDAATNINYANYLIDGRIQAGDDPFGDWRGNTLELCRPDPVAGLIRAWRARRTDTPVDLSGYVVGGGAGTPIDQRSHRREDIHRAKR